MDWLAAVKRFATMILIAALLLPATVTSQAQEERLAGSWVKIEEEKGEGYWVRLDEHGDRLKSTSHVEDGKRYFFDEDGKMLYGWISREGESVDDKAGDGYRTGGVYYCGDKDDGHAAIGWKLIEIDSEDQGREKRWFYFQENGRKVASSSITETEHGNRYRYSFDEYGVMISSKWLNAGSDPELINGKWLQHTPKDSRDPNGGDTPRWYYQRPDGALIKNKIQEIDGKAYLFDETGIMRTGLVLVKESRTYMNTVLNYEDGIWCSADEIMEQEEEYDLMYFDEESGARKEGRIRLELSDAVYLFAFKSNGKAARGPYNGYLYQNGILQSADPDRTYEIKTVDGKDFLVNTDGKIQKQGNYKNKDGSQWQVESGSAKDGYVITG